MFETHVYFCVQICYTTAVLHGIVTDWWLVVERDTVSFFVDFVKTTD